MIDKENNKVYYRIVSIPKTSLNRKVDYCEIVLLSEISEQKTKRNGGYNRCNCAKLRT